MGIFHSRPKNHDEEDRMMWLMFRISKYRQHITPEHSPVPGADRRPMIAGARHYYLPDRRPCSYSDDLRTVVGGTNVQMVTLPTTKNGICRVKLTVKTRFRKYYFVGKGRTHFDAVSHAYFDAYLSVTDQKMPEDMNMYSYNEEEENSQGSKGFESCTTSGDSFKLEEEDSV